MEPFCLVFPPNKKKMQNKKVNKNLKSSWIMWIVVLKVQFVRHEQQTLWYRIRTLMLPRVMSAAESRDFKDFLVISGYPNIITIFPCHLMSHSLYWFHIYILENNNIVSCAIRLWNIEKMQIKNIWKHDPDANIWAKEGWDWGVKKALLRDTS